MNHAVVGGAGAFNWDIGNIPGWREATAKDIVLSYGQNYNITGWTICPTVTAPASRMTEPATACSSASRTSPRSNRRHKRDKTSRGKAKNESITFTAGAWCGRMGRRREHRRTCSRSSANDVRCQSSVRTGHQCSHIVAADPTTGRTWATDPRTFEGNFNPCATLSTALVTVEGATGSSPITALMFHNGTYLGTATSRAYGFTSLNGHPPPTTPWSSTTKRPEPATPVPPPP